MNELALTISRVKAKDQGIYMCQINTDPMKSIRAFLEVQGKIKLFFRPLELVAGLSLWTAEQQIIFFGTKQN